MTYPRKDAVIATIAAVARKYAADSTSEHPEDIAAAMQFATEIAGITIDLLNMAGYLANYLTEGPEEEPF